MVRPVTSAPVSVSEPCCHDCKEPRKNADGCVQQYPGMEERDASGPAAREAFGPPARVPVPDRASSQASSQSSATALRKLFFRYR
eukprot:12367964-Alexandrium_andersonii.AAC.1